MRILLLVTTCLLLIATIAFAGEVPTWAQKANITKSMSIPVRDQLINTKVIYLTENTFEKEVLQSDEPVLVLFFLHDNENRQDINTDSQAAAALLKGLHEDNPNIKIAAYDLKTPDHYFDVVQQKWNPHGIPALLLYAQDKGKMQPVLGSVGDIGPSLEQFYAHLETWENLRETLAKSN